MSIYNPLKHMFRQFQYLINTGHRRNMLESQEVSKNRKCWRELVQSQNVSNGTILGIFSRLVLIISPYRSTVVGDGYNTRIVQFLEGFTSTTLHAMYLSYSTAQRSACTFRQNITVIREVMFIVHKYAKVFVSRNCILIIFAYFDMKFTLSTVTFTKMHNF